jgi:misacylated tRNA(Ala) deacylase
MMEKPLYFDNSYLKEFDAVVVSVDGVNIVLDKTAFYATGGGQPNDTGKLVANGKEFNVVDVKKSEQGAVHVVDQPGLKPGDKVRGVIDWEHRYRLMRMHSAAHVLSSAVNKLTGALVTGKQLDLQQSKIDFSLEVFDKNQIQQFGEEAKKLISVGALVKTYFLPREEALKIPNLIRLAERMPPSVPEWRIVEILGVDIQPCGGTHVKDIKEIGKITVLKAENKGKTQRRMYYTVD